MLFNSYAFILLFLPLTAAAYHLCQALRRPRTAIAVLVLASLLFYAWWSVRGLALLAVLMIANFAVASWLIRTRAESAPKRHLILVAGIVGNLITLGYFKYANFFLDGWAWASGAEPVFLNIVLPLGISFFTFQKIALITDAYLGKVKRLNALDYMLFVMFFPQLIAGPIVHHSEVMPQFAARRCVEMSDVALGLTIFVGGLAKKVLFADGAAQFATPVFDAAAAGTAPTFVQAWLGALAYTVQLYFDFSGYSDMAIGAALLFGIRLPVNFASPYKATSIIDFWRRWHMTLSRFLRDYLYVPLGGNRRGPARCYMNLGITMVLGGLWHGAGWTFVLWGAMHAGYLGVNHAWRALARRRAFAHRMTPLGNLAGGGMTFLAVVAAWVVFRAADVPTAGLLLSAMAGFGGSAVPVAQGSLALSIVVFFLAFLWLMPNSLEAVAYLDRSAERGRTQLAVLRWRSSRGWAIACGVVLAFCLMSLSHVTEFLYFQF